MNTISKIISILFIVGSSFAFGFFCSKYGSWWYQPKIEKLTILEAESALRVEILLPSPTELQERINKILRKARKPLIKVDGKLGPDDSKTRKGYEDAFCYQQGIYFCEKAGM